MKDLLVGQMFVIGLEGESISKKEKNFIKDKKVGGVILFSRNIISKDQLKNLITNLKRIDPSILVCIDNEGGRVQRLSEPISRSFPSMRVIGDMDQKNVDSKVKKLVFEMSKDLKYFGFNLNFSPCLDVLTNPNNVVIGDRSFSSDPKKVSYLGRLFIEEFKLQKVIPCAKHFPGHGRTSVDSHKDLPEIHNSLEELEKTDIYPFKFVSDIVPMIMTAHIKYSAIDDLPATLSHKIISILRSINFDKVIITDDLNMNALTNHWSMPEIVINAINAGCNMLLFCQNSNSYEEGYDALKSECFKNSQTAEKINRSVNKISKLKRLFKQ